MELHSLFIRRPVMTTLLMLAVVGFGILAFRLLPVAALPSVDFPTITVSASLPGANPDTMAASVATPLEQQFATIAGLSSMNSSSSLGNTQITLQFDLSRNIDAAAQDVQTAIAAAAPFLPPMPSPPTYKKVNPADMPILYLALSSDSLPLYRVDDYAETLVGQRLSMIAGVAQVNVFGSQKHAVHVEVNPDLLAARQLSLDDVRTAIANSNVNLPTGNLYGNFTSYQIKANGELVDAQQYEHVVITYKNGSPLTVADVGTALNGVQNDKTASWLNGKRAIILAVMRQPGTNTVGIVDKIKKVLPALRAQIPGAVDLGILYDRSITIRESVFDVELTLVVTVLLVVGVIFLFLRNGSATLIPSLALPASLIGTFAVMYALGFSLNNLTLMALTLSVGFVVDDAVVVLENIVRHVELGERPFEAALKGTGEIWFTVISMTLSLVAVFIPIFFMGGIIGRLFNEFAITIAAAILLSGLVSLTLTPMLCSRWLRSESTSTWGLRLTQWFEDAWVWTAQRYETTLRAALDHRLLVVLVLIGMIVITALLFGVINKGFMPEEDTGQILVSTEAAQSISFDSMVRHQQALAHIMQADPNVQSVMPSVGGSSAINQGRMFLTLKPLNQRLKAADVINELRPKLAKVPGINCYLQIPPTIRIGGQLTKALYQVALESSGTGHLYSSANALAADMRKSAAMIDVNTDMLNNAPQINVAVDRELAAGMGVTEQEVEEALADAYGMRQISIIYGNANQYQVIVEVQPQFQLNPASLARLYVRSANGGNVPLGSVAKLTLGRGPLVVNHLGQFPSATISFNLRSGYWLGGAVSEIAALARADVAPDVTYSFQGQAQAFQSSFQNAGWLLLLAVLVIYTILGMLYESFIHPITILSGLPADGLGALLTLLVFQHDLDIYGILGLIMLIGIVKKNAIMMVDFAIESRRNSHLDAHEAIFQAALVRFRPIMMTTLAALMGSLPIALGLGAGGESRQPLGLAVVGGLLVSQLLTLYFTPVVYLYLDAFERRLPEGGQAGVSTPAPGQAGA